MQVIDQSKHVGYRRFPDGMLERTLPERSCRMMELIVASRDVPIDPLHQLTDGNIVLSGDYQMEVIAHDNKGMQLHAHLQAGIKQYLNDPILFCGAKEQEPVSGSVPDMVGVIIADGAALADAQSSSARIGTIQTVLLNQPCGKSIGGFPVLWVHRATSQAAAGNPEFIEPLQQEFFRRSLDEEIQAIAKPCQVTQDEVGRVVQVALVAPEAGDNFLKQQIRAESHRQATQADAVAGKSGWRLGGLGRRHAQTKRGEIDFCEKTSKGHL